MVPQPSPPSKTRKKALIALGGNVTSTQGGPVATLSRALDALAGSGVEISACSRFYQTPCFPPGAGPDFVNACAAVLTDLGPEDLLARLHEIEADFGRERDERWGARPLDLDLLAYGDAVRPDQTTFAVWRDLPLDVQKTRAPTQLILPHPRLQDRGFVLIPLADIAPDWRHPVSGQTVAEMVQALPEAEKTDIVPL
ncbi:2-amino-4-hydroxy-6-hydroxymethyldihydropteridine diphosphokinase [Aliiroseovarius subalbicans]|uniref:2-amino-4-hydroxy-6- hydroxymethyldihydropteridine diphosphokinase n=1 Tax=Aliiroseovarius subalbicans TaxID=2925840 RepID=UPI001F5A738F|nr:2-amino-4-hydroxy-6-hydroxymethyldihydropteridine diphosphokinase [Aliiroseovarius subalbicans]MCI2399731.1 2-amino-4-hydroxy-6-hydroxymethyldihydropteridine diphosphokinase [Aliiroseovarius subalbicans]